MRQTLYTIAGCLLATGPVAAQNYAPWEVISPIPNPTGYVYNNGVQLPAANAIWVWLPTVYGHQTYVDNLCVSADNGTTWQYYGTGYSYDSNNKYGTAIVDFYALDARQAWVINTNVVTGAYTLNQTTTGATGFTISIGQVPGQPRRVRFFDATTGLVLTSLTGTTNLQLYRTADAGQTWQLASGSTLIPTTWTSGDLPILQVFGTHFWLTNKGMLLHSPDAGLTWTFTTLPETFMKLAFRDGQHGLAYGTATGQPLYRTADGGTTWSLLAPTGSRRLTNVVAVPGSAGTYVSTGKETGQLGSAVTYDEGQTWQNLENTTQLEVGAASADGRVWGGPSFGYYNSPMVFRLG